MAMQAVRNDIARAEKSAERFFGALRDVFVGAPVLQRIMAKGERIQSGIHPFSLILSPFSFVASPFSFILFLLGQSASLT